MAKATIDSDDERFAQFGLAAIIPGFQHAIDVLQERLDNARTQLAAYQGMVAQLPSASVTPMKRAYKPTGRPLGRPPAPRQNKPTGWPADPAERKAEMKRRMAVARRRKGLNAQGMPMKPHPRDPSHPKHAQWVKKVQAAGARARRAKGKADAKKLPKVILEKREAAA